MTGLWIALGLGGIALAVSLAARRLARAHWPTRAPALAVMVWQSLSLSLALSLVLAGIALLVPRLPPLTSLTELMHLCTRLLAGQLQAPASAGLTALGLAGMAALGSRFVLLLTRGRLSARRRRRRQLASLLLTGTDRADGLTVVDHRVPTVYCLPGGRGRIVATTGATQLLSTEQLDGVLAHERAHLRFRHDLALAVAEALARTFRGLQTFDLAAAQVARLVEMQADDAAGLQARPHLAMAMLRLTQGPAGALSAGGITVDRARRLLRPVAPLSRSQRAAVALTALAAVVAPLAVGLLPGSGLFEEQCCLTTLTGDAWDLDARR